MKRNSNIYNNNKNDIYITLKSERNYYQGDVISGSVVLDLQSVIRTQNVKLTLEGIAFIHNKPTTIYSTTVMLMEPPQGEKFITLEAHTHNYSFHLNAPSSKALPSTLEIPDIMTVQYKLVAVQQIQFGLLDFSKVHPTAEKEVNILEHINVNEFPMNYKELREVSLMGLEQKIRVAVDMLRCAAVKGATIPISITIDHVGVMVKDRAIKVKLLRNVYYQNTRLNVDGPEAVASTIGDIMIIGPMEFTAKTKLKLLLPSKICPTVEETGKTFKVEYLVNIIVNLNEESPHIKEREEEIVVFDIPFTIGTYPQLDYCIDDDEDDNEEEEERVYVNHGTGNNSDQEVVAKERVEEEEEEQVVVEEEEKEKVTVNKSQEPADFTEEEKVVKALDQVNLNSTSSSGAVLPEIIEQQKKPLFEDYKPDEKPDQITPPVKRRTLTYESGVQLPEFIESEPMLPVEIMENDAKKDDVNSIKNHQQVESLPQQEEISLPQERQQQEEITLPQERQEEVSLPQERQEEEVSLPQASLPEEFAPKRYQQEEKKNEQRPMMMNAYSSSTSCAPTLSSENGASYLPTPSSSSRPSSPLPAYQVSPTMNQKNSSNASLPIYNNTTSPIMNVNKTGTTAIPKEENYQLPVKLSPTLEKKSSYLSMNSNSTPESPPIHAASSPGLPPRNHSPLPPLSYFNGSNDHLVYNNSPPIPPRKNNVSPVYNRPPLPPRNNMSSPPPAPNNNYGYGPPPPPLMNQFNGGMPQPQPQHQFYNHSNYSNSSNSLYNTQPPSTPSFPPRPSPNGMPMPIFNQPQNPNYGPATSYPEPPYNMPQPQYPKQQHYYQ